MKLGLSLFSFIWLDNVEDIRSLLAKINTYEGNLEIKQQYKEILVLKQLFQLEYNMRFDIERKQNRVNAAVLYSLQEIHIKKDNLKAIDGYISLLFAFELFADDKKDRAIQKLVNAQQIYQQTIGQNNPDFIYVLKEIA